MWRPIFILTLLFVNSVLGLGKLSSTELSEDDEESATEMSIPEESVGKMGLLSTVKLVKDTKNLAEDMVASGSLMNVFIQVAPDGTTDRDLRKVLAEVEAHDSDDESSRVSESTGIQSQQFASSSRENYNGESSIKSFSASPPDPVTSEIGEQSQQPVIPIPTQAVNYIPVPINPTIAHFQSVQAQALKQQQQVQQQALEEIQQQQKQPDLTSAEQQRSNQPVFRDHDSSYENTEYQNQQNQYTVQIVEQAARQDLESKIASQTAQLVQQKELERQIAAQQEEHARKQQELDQQLATQKAENARKQQELDQLILAQQAAAQNSAEQQNSQKEFSPVKSVGHKQNSIHQEVEPEEQAESDPQGQIREPLYDPQVSFQTQAVLAQKELQDQISQQQQAIHEQQIIQLQTMQQAAFQKQNEIWQKALEQQKIYYEQQTKQAEEAQKQQALIELRQQQTLREQQQAIDQETLTRQHELHMQRLHEQKLFDDKGYNQQNVGQVFNQQQPLQGGYNSQQLSQGDFNSQQIPQGGFDGQQLLQGGYDGQQLLQGGYNGQQLSHGGYNGQQPLQGGYNGLPQQGGYNGQLQVQGGYNGQQTQQGSYNSLLQQQGAYSGLPQQQAGYNGQIQLQGGYNGQQPLQGGYNGQQSSAEVINLPQPPQRGFHQKPSHNIFNQQPVQQSFHSAQGYPQLNQQSVQNFAQQSAQNFNQQPSQSFRQQPAQNFIQQNSIEASATYIQSPQDLSQFASPTQNSPIYHQQSVQPRLPPNQYKRPNEVEQAQNSFEPPPQGFATVRETPLYTIYKVQQNIRPISAFKSGPVDIPQQNGVYTVQSPVVDLPRYHQPSPQNFVSEQKSIIPRPVPSANPYHHIVNSPPVPIRKEPIVPEEPVLKSEPLFQTFGPSSTPFLGTGGIKFFGPNPTPFLGASSPSVLEGLLGAKPEGGFPRPIPLPRRRNEGVRYEYAPGATFPSDELTFAAHQAAVLGGPAFREEPHSAPLPSPPAQDRQSNLRLKSQLPQTPKSNRRRFQSSASTTRHHIRDPQFGELEVKEIGVGKKSSIPKNVLANLLRVTTGDELIEFD